MAGQTENHIRRNAGKSESELAKEILTLPSVRNRPSIKFMDVIDCIGTVREQT